MDSRTLAFSICATVAWTAVGYKLVALRRDPADPALWALTGAIALPAAGFTMAVPAVYRAVSGLFGVPNLASLLIYLCIVGYSVTALAMLILWHLPAPQARPRVVRLLAGYLVVLAALVFLFFRIHAPEERPVDFDEAYGVSPAGGTFLLVYVGAFAVSLVAAARRGRQFGRRVALVAPDRPWLRRGLRLIAVGSLVALGYCLGKAVFVLAAWAGTDLTPVSAVVAPACACLGALVITAGFTVPSWGPGLAATRRWLRSARAYLRLYPLWRLLHRALPCVALDPPSSRYADLLLLRDLDYRLYRRLIEIHDARLALLPHLAPAGPEADRIAARHRLPVAAVREAVQLREAAVRVRDTALAGARSGSAGCPGAPPASSGAVHARTGEATSHDRADDLDQLVAVAHALRHLPGPTR